MPWPEVPIKTFELSFAPGASAACEVYIRCYLSIAMIESMVKSDKNNVQAVADLASSNLAMGLALCLTQLPREALAFVQRSDPMFRNVALRDLRSSVLVAYLRAAYWPFHAFVAAL